MAHGSDIVRVRESEVIEQSRQESSFGIVHLDAMAPTIIVCCLNSTTCIPVSIQLIRPAIEEALVIQIVVRMMIKSSALPGQIDSISCSDNQQT